GMYGVKNFQAIVNPPEAAILAVGGTSAQAVAKDGQVAVAEVMNLSLSCDHRVIDGATGAKFLGEIKTLLEQPLAMLI
ncbi:MAG: 2-oxo acid dehydrogenase subunit E2, partial [Phycisphaerae bacterium]